MRRKLPAPLSIGIDRDRENVERWASDQSIDGLQLYCCCGIEWLRHHFGLYRVIGLYDKVLKSDRQPPNDASTAEDAENSGQGLRKFVYLDPPYLIASRRSRRAIYRHEMTDDDHAELLDTALQLPCSVMISHYPHPMYAKGLRDWRTFTFDAQTRGGARAREQVWCNYDEPAELHDARYVGRNKRERERVRRRVRNWCNGLDRMLPDERQAILDAIAGRYIQRLPTSPN